MKSILIKRIKDEFGIKNYMGKSIKAYNFYELCSIYKTLKNASDLDEEKL